MLILASKSPRRKELLHKICSDFIVISPDINEDESRKNPHDHPLDVSRLKAYEVFKKYPNDDILACDTVVIIDNLILGKPQDEKDAYHMLKMLSGKRHVVLSGYTYINPLIEINRTVKTEVYFKDLSDDLIANYIKTGSSFDKAGAYGIQDGFDLVDHIVGSFDNVMGFPSEDIKKHCFKTNR
ncbi:MAG: septum formation protein Maf [Erysipelotrichia bacterium]|jgi:septum formation protein|nr:septum formation protein Maf [Erysipelotrichia bacterium]